MLIKLEQELSKVSGLKETLKEMFPNTKLFNIYGATESGCTVSLEFSKYGDKKGVWSRTS